MRKLRFLALIFLILSLISLVFILNISASCSENQIDINTASLEELDELYGIGPVKAQEIFNSRPFASVDELIRVKGIGEATLSKIKEQGLACVSHEEDSQEDQEQGQEQDQEPSTAEINESTTDTSENLETKTNLNEKIDEDGRLITLETMELIPKDIKTSENEKTLDKSYSIYGFIAFCILLAVLFSIKKIGHRKENGKNEFG